MSAVEEGRPEDSPLFEFELIYPRPGTKLIIDQEPTGRSGHSMVADESNLYVLGGYNPLGRVLNLGRPTVLEELWQFNLATRKWKKLECIGFPATCASSCMLLRGNNIYVFGGTSYPFGQFVSNAFKVCDIGNPQRDITGVHDKIYTWYNLLDGRSSPQGSSTQDLNIPPFVFQDDENKPPKGYGQSVVFHGEYIYTFGGAVGFYNEAIADMHRLSLVSLTWEKLEPSGEAPEGRYKQEIIKDQDCFYIVGGGRLHAAQHVHILYSYSFLENTWSKRVVPPDPVYGSPKPRNAFSLVQIDRDVYISGGQCYGMNSPPEILNDVWHLSLDTFRWTKLRVTLPERMYFHRAVVSPAKHLYVYGGVLESSKRSHKIYRYRLPYQTPELKELCWFVVSSRWRDLRRADPKELREKYGIPQCFVDRLPLS
ncbi:kelch domain-containing protein 10-like [Littorina saxatilis]|uniref:Kelch domain-containing protein 10 n=1 Tax=Littorina saxatilis TaxID=31220 RepID=A0AAN9APD4_9CAEN